jgi:hypothetical protein
MYGNSAQTVSMPSGTSISVAAVDKTSFSPTATLVDNTIIVSNAEPNSTAVVKAGSSTINVPINSSGNGSVPRGNIPAGSTLTVEDTSSTCEAEITEGYEVVPDDVDLRAGKGSVDVDEVSYKFIYSGCRPNDQIKVTVTTPAPSANTSTKIIKIVK